MAKLEEAESRSLDYMAIEPSRQHATSLSLSIVAGPIGQLLNSDYIRVISVEGQEQVSQPYRFTISLRANEDNLVALAQTQTQNSTSSFAALPNEPYPQVDLLTLVQGNSQALLGQWARLTLGYEYHSDEGSESGPAVEGNFATDRDLPPRYFSGIISSISQSAPGEYTAELQSPLFPLTLRNRYFVFKGLNIANLIKALIQPELSRYGNTFSVDCTRVRGAAATRVQDWMQAGETDFAMLQRIMKKAAVHFYFIHAADKLTVVFSNQTTGPEEVTIPSTKTGSVALRYSYTDAQSLGLQQNDLFCNLSYKMQMVPQTVGAALVRQEAVWETNNVAEHDSFLIPSDIKDVNYLFYKNYSYGVDKSEAEEARRQIEQEVATQQGTLTGESTSNLLSPGYTFTLTQVAINPKDASLIGNEKSLHPVTANNLMPAQFDGQTFVVTKITHKVTEHTPYSGTIEATSVSTNTKQSDATFITPFDIQDTHQGSVLATVVESAVPKNPYFFEKNNFSTELSSVGFDGQQQSQIGCLVQFATDEGTDIKHWVALSDTAQTAPARNSMVMVGRGGNESEIPQIQQVVSSHGEKTIQPAFWKNNSWSFNTSWGSNCNTSYGDSISIHFGSEATADLKTAMNIVQSAYDNPSVLGANIGGASYDKGCSFSYSTTGKGAQGLANASVSQGSRFSESHSEQDYSVGYTNTRQSFSKTNKSVNVSYQGPFTDVVDESNLSFINGKIPNQDIIDICNSLPDGSIYNRNHITGHNINLNGTGRAPPSLTDGYEGFLTYSNSIVAGATMDISEVMGDSISVSNFLGAKQDTSTVTGVATTISNFLGAKLDTSNVTGESMTLSTYEGACQSVNTFMGLKYDRYIMMGNSTSFSSVTGDKLDTSTVEGNSTSISSVIGNSTSESNFTGNKSDTSTVEGNSTSISSVIGDSTSESNFTGNKSDTSTVEGNSTSISSVIGDSTSESNFTGNKTDMNIVEGNSESTSSVLGDSTSVNNFIGVRNDTTIVNGEDINSKEKSGITVNMVVLGGVTSDSEEHAGVESVSRLGPAGAHTDERVKAIQISVTNITVEGIISIL